MEISIKDLVHLIARLTGFEGEIIWDASKPDRQPQRCLDATEVERFFGFKAKTPFEERLQRTIKWYEQARAGSWPDIRAVRRGKSDEDHNPRWWGWHAASRRNDG